VTETLSVVVAVGLAGWFAVIVLAQPVVTRRVIRRVIKRDRLGLIPGWWFFAPNVGDVDVHVLFRDRDRDGRVGAWSEPFAIGRERVTEVWDPHWRIKKALVDVAENLSPLELRREGVRPLSRAWVLSFPYLVVLNYVSQLSGELVATERQFAMVRTGAIQAQSRPEILIVSPFHRLPASE
jgi:hypothetical protein